MVFNRYRKRNAWLEGTAFTTLFPSYKLINMKNGSIRCIRLSFLAMMVCKNFNIAG